MITVLAGDFKKDGVAVFKKALGGLGKPTHLVLPLPGFMKTEKIALGDIVGVETVTEASLNAGGAVAGGLLFGLAGAAMGALVGSGAVVALSFRDGRKVLVRCGRSDLTTFTAAAFDNQAAPAV